MENSVMITSQAPACLDMIIWGLQKKFLQSLAIGSGRPNLIMHSSVANLYLFDPPTSNFNPVFCKTKSYMRKS